MKLKGEVNFWVREGSICQELFMYVRYKHPRKMFRRTIKVLLSTIWSKKIDTYEEFLEDCLDWINDKEGLMEVAAEEMIADYHKINKESPRDKLSRELLAAIKSINKKGFEIEVEVDEK